MNHCLFVYGSLRDERVYFNVVGEPKPIGRDAVLNDYAYAAPIDGYPVIVSEAGEKVAGEILEEISDAALAKLDAYEENGVDYHRIRVWVATGETKVDAFVYVGMK